MNVTRFTSVLLALGIWFVSFAARADDRAASARFASTVGTDMLRSSACGLTQTVTIDGQPRHVDVSVEGRRCDSSQADASWIRLAVRAEGGEERHVVLEMRAPAEVGEEALHQSIVQIEGVLAARVAIAMALQPVALRNAGLPTPSAQDLPRFDAKAWHRLHHHRDGERVAAIVIPSVLAGIALFVGVGVALASCQCFSGMGMHMSGW